MSLGVLHEALQWAGILSAFVYWPLQLALGLKHTILSRRVPREADAVARQEGLMNLRACETSRPQGAAPCGIFRDRRAAIGFLAYASGMLTLLLMLVLSGDLAYAGAAGLWGFLFELYERAAPPRPGQGSGVGG